MACRDFSPGLKCWDHRIPSDSPYWSAIKWWFYMGNMMVSVRFYDPYHGIQLGKNKHDDFCWFVWTECPGKWSCADGSEPVIPYLGGSMWINIHHRTRGSFDVHLGIRALISKVQRAGRASSAVMTCLWRNKTSAPWTHRSWGQFFLFKPEKNPEGQELIQAMTRDFGAIITLW